MAAQPHFGIFQGVRIAHMQPEIIQWQTMQPSGFDKRPPNSPSNREALHGEA